MCTLRCAWGGYAPSLENAFQCEDPSPVAENRIAEVGKPTIKIRCQLSLFQGPGRR